MVRTLSFLSALALLVLAPMGVSAQERDWSISLVAEGGGMLPIRTLGKNSGVLPQLDDQQVISELDNTAFWGGGVELMLPGPMLRVRAMYHTTQGGAALGRIAICGDRNQPLLTGPLCEDFVSDSNVESLSVDLAFIRAPLTNRFRPVIYLGAGLRQYTLNSIDCPDPSFTDDTQTIRALSCDLVNQLWSEDGGITPFLRFGAGLDVDLGIFELRTSGIAGAGRYPGGTGSADGHTQIDILLNAGLAVKVF